MADIAREDMVHKMEWLRSTIGELTQSLRRTVTLALLLMAIFELVIGSRALTLSVGSFTISSGSIVIFFIPAVISYLYLQLKYDTRQLQYLQKEFVYMFHTWSPPKDGWDPSRYRCSPRCQYTGNLGSIYTLLFSHASDAWVAVSGP